MGAQKGPSESAVSQSVLALSEVKGTERISLGLPGWCSSKVTCTVP